MSQSAIAGQSRFAWLVFASQRPVPLRGERSSKPVRYARRSSWSVIPFRIIFFL